MWWIIAVASICVALLVQYLCSSKILRMKQAISIKSISLRDVRDEGDKLDQQEMELKTQQISLGQSVVRLRKDIKGLQEAVSDRGIPVPDPGFSLEEDIPTGRRGGVAVPGVGRVIRLGFAPHYNAKSVSRKSRNSFIAIQFRTTHCF